MNRLMMIAFAAVATAGGALTAATPAAAQHYRHAYHGRYYGGGWSGGWYGPGVGVYVGPGYGYGYYPYYGGCRIRLRWDPYFRAYVRERVCY